MWYLICAGLFRIVVPLVVMLVLVLVVHAYGKHRLVRLIGFGLIGSVAGFLLAVLLMSLLSVTCGIAAMQAFVVIAGFEMVVGLLIGLVIEAISKM